MLLKVRLLQSFLCLSDSPLCTCTAPSLPVCVLMDTEVASMSWLLWVVPLWTLSAYCLYLVISSVSDLFLLKTVQREHLCTCASVSCRPGFLRLSTADVLGQVILYGEGCLLHCRMFAGLDALDASGPTRALPTPPLFVMTQTSLEWG